MIRVFDLQKKIADLGIVNFAKRVNDTEIRLYPLKRPPVRMVVYLKIDYVKLPDVPIDEVVVGDARLVISMNAPYVDNAFVKKFLRLREDRYRAMWYGHLLLKYPDKDFDYGITDSNLINDRKLAFDFEYHHKRK